VSSCRTLAADRRARRRGRAIPVDAALSFLGSGSSRRILLGFRCPFGRNPLSQAPWYATFAGLSIFVTVLAQLSGRRAS
jgi:ABC-type dipeptide/oligopeptide/nickel transport system permease subunit